MFSIIALYFYVLFLITSSSLFSPVSVSARAVPGSLLDLRQLVRRDDLNVVTPDTKADACSLLDVDDVQSLPGWAKLEQYVRDTWGDGDYTIQLNPPNYKDKPAAMCVQNPAPVNVTGEANCTEKRVDIQPKGNSKSVKVDAGYTNVGTWNITGVSSAAHAQFFTAKFQMPNLTDAQLVAIQGKGDFINALGNNFQTKATNVTYTDVKLTSVSDKTCIGTILNSQCLYPSVGRIQLAATGYIWFTFDTKRAPVAKPNGGKHKRYTVKIEDVLTDIEDRSAYIDFTGFMNTTMRSDYYDECRWNFKL